MDTDQEQPPKGGTDEEKAAEITNVQQVSPAKKQKPVLSSFCPGREDIENAGLDFNLLEQYENEGYFILNNVFESDVIDDLLDGGIVFENRKCRIPRKCKEYRQIWCGARKMIKAQLEAGGYGLAQRGKGRFDLQLPTVLRPRIELVLKEKKVFKYLETLCPKARVTTENIMLSAPGAARQGVHTDSSWELYRSRGKPPIHYITVLIPLTEQTIETGGTRVWPRSHLNSSMEVSQDTGFIDMLSPKLKVGDALFFDGLLAHCGLENTSEILERYFFYLAFSTKFDENTSVTMEI